MEGLTEDGLQLAHIMMTQVSDLRLPWSYGTRKTIRVLFWTVVGAVVGSMLWNQGLLGTITGMAIGATLALTIDEKFYKKKGEK